MAEDAPGMDRVAGQLYHLPEIISRMGLSIANAQKAFDLDYLNNVSRVLELIKSVGGDANAEQMKSLLETLAPSRHQYTEATLEFSADLAETMDAGGSVGLGFGTPAITVNAAFALSYGYDYRAAARITVKMHAVPANPEMTKAFLDRAGKIDEKQLTMPEKSEVESQIFKSVDGLHKALTASGGG